MQDAVGSCPATRGAADPGLGGHVAQSRRSETHIHPVVYYGVMSRTNIEIDDALVAAVQRMYRLPSKRSAVDLALRRLIGEALGRDEALALQGSGFDFTNDEVESFSDSGIRDRKSVV